MTTLFVTLLCTISSPSVPAADATVAPAPEAEAEVEVIHAESAEAGSSMAVGIQATVETSEVPVPPVAEEAVPESRLKGSSISYGNVATALSADPGANITYNPYWAMNLSLQPRFRITAMWTAHMGFDIASEVTQADWTTERFYIGDLDLGVSSGDLYNIPVLDIGVSTDVSASLPTSKASRAATRLFSGSLSVNLSRGFGRLSLSYSASVGKDWNRYSTGAPTSRLLGACSLTNEASCIDVIVQSGSRNASWSVSNGASMGLDVTNSLSLSGGIGVTNVFLYALPADQRVSYETTDPQNVRYYVSSSVSARLTLSKAVTATLGARSSHGQLATDGTYRRPLVNRYTQVFFNLRMSLDPIFG